VFATHVVVDGRLVTGQNQNSGTETAHRMMEVALAANADDASDVPDSTSAQEPVEGDEPQKAEQEAGLTSERFPGTYDFSGGEHDRQALSSAIETLAAEIPLLMRSRARNKLNKLSAIQDWINLSTEEGQLTYTNASGAKWVGDCDGRPYEGNTIGGRKMTSTRSLSHNDESLLVLTEQRKVETSGRTHRYILSKDENSLTLDIAFNGSRLPRSLEYPLT